MADQGYRQKLCARYFFQMELQQTIEAFSNALDHPGEFLRLPFEKEAPANIESKWKEITAEARKATQDLLADLPKNTRPQMIFLFEEMPPKQDLWGDCKEIDDPVERRWTFTPEFGAQLRSLLAGASKRLTRIRFLNLWTLLQEQEAASIERLAKNRG